MRVQVRKIAVLLAVPALAIGLSGCIGISAISTNQPESLGPVQLTLSACADGAPGCAATSNRGNIYQYLDMETVDSQILLGVRLPEGSTPPALLTAALGGGGALSFARSTSYEAELQALQPAPAGERWWGWLSGVVEDYNQKSKQSFTVTITASLPRPADGGPFESPMHWRPVVGARFVSTTTGLPADRAVRCGTTTEDLYSGYTEGNSGETVTCVDSPTPEATTGFIAAPITDFGILGSSIQASPGSTATAVFLAKRSGSTDPPTIFTLTPQSGIPGGTVSIDRSSISLSGDSSQPVLATIGVPTGTPAGTYPVTLNATSPGKPDRSGAVTVMVPGALEIVDERPSIRSASLTRKRFRARTKRSRSGKAVAPKVGTKLKLDLSEGAKLSIEVAKLGKRPKALGTATKSLPAGMSTIGIRGRIGQIKLGTGSHRITLRAEDSAGQRSAPKQLQFTVIG